VISICHANDLICQGSGQTANYLLSKAKSGTYLSSPHDYADTSDPATAANLLYTALKTTSVQPEAALTLRLHTGAHKFLRGLNQPVVVEFRNTGGHPATITVRFTTPASLPIVLPLTQQSQPVGHLLRRTPHELAMRYAPIAPGTGRVWIMPVAIKAPLGHRVCVHASLVPAGGAPVSRQLCLSVGLPPG
jgi:hypothetical protein